MRVVAMGVAVAGVALLVWTATPIWWDGLASAAAGQVQAVAFLAVFFGTPAGVVAGLIGRRRVSAGHRSTGPGAVIAFLAVSPFPLGLIGVVTVVRFSASDHEPLNSSRVFVACVAWLVYVALAYLLYWIVSGRAAGLARSGPASRGTG